MTRFAGYRNQACRGLMRSVVYALSFVSALGSSLWLAGCDGCQGSHGPSAEERSKLLASAIAAPPMPSVGRGAVDSIGHAANVIPGQGPKRIEFMAPRMGNPMPILPGQGVG